MDGGSLDGTVELLRDSPHIRWWSEPDKGQSDAINKGIRQARGTLITWLNADDVLEPGAVDRVVAAWRTNPDAAVFYGDCAIVEGDRRTLWTPPPRIRTQDFDNRGPLPQVGTFVTANALNEVGGVDDQLHLAMDFDLFLRMSLAGHQFVYTGATLATFVLHANSKSGANIHGEFLREEARSLLAAGRTEPANGGARPSRRPRRVVAPQAVGVGLLEDCGYFATGGAGGRTSRGDAGICPVGIDCTSVATLAAPLSLALRDDSAGARLVGATLSTARRAQVESARMKSLGVRDDAAEAPADSSGAKTTAIAGLWLSALRVLGLVAALITVPLAARSLAPKSSASGCSSEPSAHSLASSTSVLRTAS